MNETNGNAMVNTPPATNINNNLINMINTTANKYKLTKEETNQIFQLFQNSPKDAETLQKEIEDTGNYFYHQHKLNEMCASAKPLEQGKNYYVTAFDQNSNIYLEPVSITVTNSATSEVLVENTFKAHQVHTAVDDIEIAICQIGKLLDFDISEEYRLYNAGRLKDSIIIRDLINENEFYTVENLKKRFSKLIANGKLKKESWFDECEQLTVANTKEDYRLIIDYGLNILKSLPSILEEDYKEIENKYFDMLIFDSLIGQSERNFKDYGIICDKVTKRYSYAPLFDNVFPSILKNNDVISINDITCNRYDLTECLFYNYYDKISKRVEKIIQNKDKYLQNIDVILKYNVNLNNYNMLKNNIAININNFDKLNKERAIVRSNNNSGYVNIVQLLIGLIVIIGFSVCIAYLLYNIK